VDDVADDRDSQPIELTEMVEDCAGIQQRLSRMLVGSVACVQNRSTKVAREEVRRAGRRVTHDDGVGPHGNKRVQSIDQRLAFGDAGRLRLNGTNFSAEPACGNFEAYASSSGCFEEEIYQTSSA
jgi:hypothetical protein